MGSYWHIELEGIDRDLYSRDNWCVCLDLDPNTFPVGAIITAEDWARQQDCAFERTATGWRQIYSATWPNHPDATWPNPAEIFPVYSPTA
jgi:hypothetical protein